MIKLCVLCPRKPDLTLEQFEAHWRNIHGPLFSSQPEAQQFVKKYIQVHNPVDLCHRKHRYRLGLN